MVLLMLTWLDFVDIENNSRQFQCLEFFAGVGRIGRLAHSRGYRSACYDIQFDPLAQEAGEPSSSSSKRAPSSCRGKKGSGTAMDFGSDGGFLFLDLSQFVDLYNFCWFLRIDPFKRCFKKQKLLVGFGDNI